MSLSFFIAINEIARLYCYCANKSSKFDFLQIRYSDSMNGIMAKGILCFAIILLGYLGTVIVSARAARPVKYTDYIASELRVGGASYYGGDGSKNMKAVAAKWTASKVPKKAK